MEEERVMGFVEEAVRGWLRGQGFLAEARDGKSQSARVESTREPLSDEELTPVKSVREGLTKYLSPHGPLLPRPRTPIRKLGLGAVSSAPRATRAGAVRRQITPDIAQPAVKRPRVPQVGQDVVIDTNGAEPVRWTDPVSGEMVLIDPRSGNSWRVGERPSDVRHERDGPAPIGRLRIDRSKLRRDLPQEGEHVALPPEWMARALEVSSSLPCPPYNRAKTHLREYFAVLGQPRLSLGTATGLRTAHDRLRRFSVQ